MTSKDFEETYILLVKLHNEILLQECFLSCHTPTHSCHDIAFEIPNTAQHKEETQLPRSPHATLTTRHRISTQTTSHKHGKQHHIHEYVDPVLNLRPPSVNLNETFLPSTIGMIFKFYILI